MRGLFGLAFAATAALIGQSLAVPIVVDPGNASDLIITEDNTLNATHTGNQTLKIGGAKVNAAQGTQNLRFSLQNNFGGGNLNAYVTGLDPNNALVMLSPDGTFYYPDPAGSASPVPITANVAIPLNGQGQTTEFTLPDYISSGRVWIAQGDLQFFTVQAASGPQLVEPSAVNPDDPSAGINWGFVELTNTADGGVYANISYVDFVGLVLGMSLTGGDGSVQTAQGLRPTAVTDICNDLKTQAASDGQPWDKLCVTDSAGNPLRVLAPNDYLSIDPSAWADYYTDYVNQVWTQYTGAPLTINTQGAAGNVTCQVSGGSLTCGGGDNRGYAQPTVGDIWGCNSGPFAIAADDNDVHKAVVPRLCAAFERTTLLIPGGDVQPGVGRDQYYMNSPTNHYSRVVHSYEIDGRGYAFSYDDVNPDGQNESGVVSDPNPQLLEIIIGGPAS